MYLYISNQVHDIHDTNSNSKMQIRYLSLCPAVASENTTTVKTPNTILLSKYQTTSQCSHVKNKRVNTKTNKFGT